MMHKMHDGIDSDNLFFLRFRGLIAKPQTATAMIQQKNSLLPVSNFGVSGRLPRLARRVGPPGPSGLVEFVVIVGNASYREGEHFFLTAEQARRAYAHPRRVENARDGLALGVPA
jgi:hypothetical protein